MTADRITHIQIEGLRALARVHLQQLQGLTVLIGDNGTGKSTLLEAFELLRLAAKPGILVEDALDFHGGFLDLLARGSSELALSVRIEGNGRPLTYSFAVALKGSTGAITREWLREDAGHLDSEWLARDGNQDVRVSDIYGGNLAISQVPAGALVLPSLALTGTPAVRRMVSALSRIECHFPFETRPLWQQQELDVRSGPRWPVPFDRHERVARYGINLASCIQQIRNGPRDSWERLLSRAQLGLGEDLRDLTLAPSGRGSVDLELVFAAWPDKPLSVRALSEGQISYLLMVAMFELGRDRSILLFDEPELHLHPELLARVVQMFEEESKTCPVIIATQSDQLVDALDDPSKSVVLAEREDGGIAFRRPNPTALARWMERYRGLGAIRAEGFEKHVFDGGERVGGKRS